MFQGHEAVIKKVIQLTESKDLKWHSVENDAKTLNLLKIERDSFMHDNFVYKTDYSGGYFYYYFYSGAYSFVAQSSPNNKPYMLDASNQELLSLLIHKINAVKHISRTDNEKFLNDFLDD